MRLQQGIMMDPQANHRFEEFVRQHHGRLTPQRLFIVKEFLALNGHYDIQELHNRFRGMGRTINPSTIFRTLKLLVQAGVAAERQFANGNTKFEVNVSHHDHLICLGCSSIFEFDSPKLEQLQSRIIRNHGFEMSYHKHEIYGYCADCRKSRKHAPGK
jgi:Fur family transcriptional regulator, ferric uptake regulator